VRHTKTCVDSLALLRCQLLRAEALHRVGRAERLEFDLHTSAHVSIRQVGRAEGAEFDLGERLQISS
jgi:hypothetical protein